MAVHHPFERARDWLNHTYDEQRFRREYTPTHLPAQRKLGHTETHKPKASLEEYLTTDVSNIDVPTAVHRAPLKGLGVLLNDTLSDCGPAMAIHGTEMFHRDAGTPVPPFADEDAEDFYEVVGGYVPGDPSTDNGVNNKVLVEKWTDVGITCKADGSVHKITSSLFVPEPLVKLAVWEFVVCYRAYGLPKSAQSQRHWTLVPDAPADQRKLGGWGYHDIPICAFGPDNYGLISWGAPFMAGMGFDRNYAVGGFVATTPEQLNLSGVSPAGVDWTKLNADIAAMRTKNGTPIN